MSRSVCFLDSCGPAEGGGVGEPSQLFCLWNALQEGGGLGPPGCPRHSPEAAHLKLGKGQHSAPRVQGAWAEFQGEAEVLPGWVIELALGTCRVKSERPICLSPLSWKPSPIQPSSLLPALVPALPLQCTAHSHHFFLVLKKKSLQ